MKRKWTSKLALASAIFGMVCSMTACNNSDSTKKDAATGLSKSSTHPLKLWYKEPAPNSHEGWENLSLPIGNGWFGSNIFGGVDTERIQISEKSMYVKDGFTNFCEMYLDFGHSSYENYTRQLDIDHAVAAVEYDYNDVTYQREYFTSYPDKIMAVKLSASKKGQLSFTLRPEIPYMGEQRTGKVQAEGDTITLSGELTFYKLKYEAQFKVIPTGGEIISSNVDGKGTLSVKDADSVVILVALGTNYVLDSTIYTTQESEKKLGNNPNPHEKVTAIMDAASQKTYDSLLEAHKSDYKELFSRVQIDLGGTVPEVPTNILLNEYQAGNTNKYLEELYFQYGRYLLIAMSREGTLPGNLQGTWNVHEVAPWSGGYWLNINFEMNYWPAFNTNLMDTFTPYVKLLDAMRKEHQNIANEMLKRHHPEQFEEGEGANGWISGTGNTAYGVGWPWCTSYFGTGSFTAQNLWEYYLFTGDKKILEESVYPTAYGCSLFTSKAVKTIDGYGDLLLCSPSYSPENMQEGDYIESPGTPYDQQLVYMDHENTIEAAKILGKTNDPLIEKLKNQMPKLDPIVVGWSGQIKEFREELYYGDLGEYNHRHISQLIGMYPGNLINMNTPAWMDAAKVSLNERGDQSTGWSLAHKLNLWARTQDGNRTYKVFQELIKSSTYENLWDKHPPFQIDGNLGGTSGVGEMLLQSHAGYIQPLAARPDEWDTGMYQGLVARGNFEVSAWWEKGQAKKFEIVSRNGGVCKLKYDDIDQAFIKSSKGEKVSFKKEAVDLISFDTSAGAVYTIESIPEFSSTQPASDLQFTEDIAHNITLHWQPSTNATAYRVYKAIESSAQYEQIAENVTDTTYTDQTNTKKQCTYKVVGVQNGRESLGVTKTLIPVLSPPSNAGGFVEGATIYMTWDAVNTADKYHIYKKGSAGYEKIAETKDTKITLDTVAQGEYGICAEANLRLGEMAVVEIRPNGMATQSELSSVIQYAQNFDSGMFEKVACESFKETIQRAEQVLKNADAQSEQILIAIEQILASRDALYTGSRNAFYKKIIFTEPSNESKENVLSAIVDGDFATGYLTGNSHEAVSFKIRMDKEIALEKIVVCAERDPKQYEAVCTIEIFQEGDWKTLLEKKLLDKKVNTFVLPDAEKGTNVRFTIENKNSHESLLIYELQAWGKPF